MLIAYNLIWKIIKINRHGKKLKRHGKKLQYLFSEICYSEMSNFALKIEILDIRLGHKYDNLFIHLDAFNFYIYLSIFQNPNKWF